MKYPIIIHVPHSSFLIPDDVRSGILLSDEDLYREIIKMTDWYTNELTESVAEICVIHQYQFSRLVVDPERFRNKEDEIMEEKGMGAVYTRTSDGKLLRKIDNSERESLLKTYYDPHLNKFESLINDILKKFGKCLIIDLHSFPSRPLPYELDQNPDRPDICVGTDYYHTTEELVFYIEEFIINYQLSVKRDSPFSGSYVPGKYYASDKRVFSVMLELNRALYMDETLVHKAPSFTHVKGMIEELIANLVIYESNI